MPEMAPPGDLRIALMILGALAFLSFEWDLHCTQTTSFFIAVFDREAHAEDNGFSGGDPLVYRPGYAWPLRAILGLSLLVALFAPAGAVIGRRLDALSSSGATLVSFLSPLLAFAEFVLLPEEVIGERFHELSLFASLWSALLATIGASVLVGLAPQRREPSR
jgi:uncharacterized membrane protein YhaH (DUF805 family)